MADETARVDGIGVEANSAHEGAPPPLASSTDFAANAKDLTALRDAVVNAAGVGAGLWFSYLFVLLYLAIAAGSVTHRDLLYESPVKLPFLNVDLPLIGFFVLGPLLFAIVHAYVLLHIGLLARKVRAFDTELRSQVAEDDTRARLRLQLPSNIFVQFLAGPMDVRTGTTGMLLKAIAWISLVIGPIALLVFFVLQFLPYHSESVSWWQRLLVCADLGLLWVLWSQVVRSEEGPWASAEAIKGGRFIAAGASALPLILAFTVATFPGEWIDAHLPNVRVIPVKTPSTYRSDVSPRELLAPPPPLYRWMSLHELLINGDVDLVARKPRSLWSNRLVLPGIDVIDRAKFDTEAKIAAVTETFSLRGRHLEGAVLIGARLRKVDFTAAQLKGTVLDDADIREAKFCDTVQIGQPGARSVSQIRCANIKDAILIGAKLHGALLPADLRGARLHEAQLQGMNLSGAQLQGAGLRNAQLQGTNLDKANLSSADLTNAQLYGASLDNTTLTGASLEDARLRGAWLGKTQLQSAELSYAWLDGAWLGGTDLRGADLGHTELRGALLVNVDLQGANLGRVGLEDAFLDSVSTWRANVNPEGKKENVAFIRNSRRDPSGSFATLKQQIEKQLLEGGRRKQALQRIEILNPDTPLKDENEMTKPWALLERSSLSIEVYENRAVAWLRKIGCESDGAPHVIRGLLRQLPERFDRLRTPSPQPAVLAACFLDEANCPGARGLSDEDKAKLREIRDRRPPAPSCPAPKPDQ
jgi:uncharacterized protein YjbI with pentapeptide repeats